ncbi:hypothetical protein FACS1894109_15900 [Spirochaetia bacterium]|nr:hypothetical protein FACS1894109_15900 [Spirochaetia bacterium]
MKKIRYFVLVLAAMTMLTNASVWEGAAAAAVRGELPNEGYYAATNSFPRNTAVDITNLETGKTVRAIVSAGLDSPGLLATLSRDAAASIGLESQSIGRIRMIQPSDPIAFSRFTEGLSTSGDPDYDPRAMVSAGTGSNDTAPASNSNLQARQQVPAAPARLTVPSSLSSTSASTAAKPNYNIVDIPANPDLSLSDSEGPGKTEDEAKWDDYWDAPAEKSDPVRFTAGEWNYFPPESTLYPIWAQGGSVGVIDGPDMIDQVADTQPVIRSAPLETITEPRSPARNPTAVAPVPVQQESRQEPVPATETKTIARAKNDPQALALLPAEQRPPEVRPEYTIPPEAFIAPIERAQAAPVQAPQAAPAPVQGLPSPINESLFIDLIEKNMVPAQPAAPPQAPPAIARPEDYMDESLFVDPIEKGSQFSVPLISELERGKYYLQLGAFSQPASVEDALEKIDKSYPLKVQAEGSQDKPTYRILVGPVNQGESGALLQRFKRSGYGDAFVKSN